MILKLALIGLVCLASSAMLVIYIVADARSTQPDPLSEGFWFAAGLLIILSALLIAWLATPLGLGWLWALALVAAFPVFLFLLWRLVRLANSQGSRILPPPY